MNTRFPLILSTAALAVALLGATPVAGAVRGLVLPAASVGSDQLRANAVTTAKIRNGSVTALDVQKRSLTGAHVRDGSLLAADFKPGQLPAGPRGEKGEPGATNVVFRRDEVPLLRAGSWVQTVDCVIDETLVGGGAAILTPGGTAASSANAALTASYPATTALESVAEGRPGRRWVATAYATAASDARLVVFAACAKPRSASRSRG